MELKQYKGDLLTSKADVICHQTNCLGIMGGGVALQIRRKWPQVYEEYVKYCEQFQDNPEKLLGDVQMCSIGNGQYVANIFGQCYCGTDKRYTDYEALKKGFAEVANWVKSGRVQSVAFPKLFGCGLAGGDWSIVSVMIEDAFKHTDAVVEIWEFQG